MDYCPPCRRHLNGALACPGCGTPAGFLPHAAGRTGGARPGPGAAPAHGAAPGQTPPPTQEPPPTAPPGEQVYRAQPFPHDPPPEAVAGPAESAAYPSRHDEEPADAPEDAAGGEDGRRSARRGSTRARGRRARPGHGKRLLVLSVCLGTALLGMTVTEVGTPTMPWTEPSASGPDTRTVGDAEEATKTPDDAGGSPSDSPSSRTPGAPGAHASPSASAAPSEEPSPSGTSAAAPEPTEVTGTVAPDPDQSPTGPPTDTSDPTPPGQDPPDDDYDDCWLIFCS